MSDARMEAQAKRDPEITGLTANSRDVRPGYLFAALPGSKADGRAFIGDAIARGAAAILTAPADEPALDALPVPVVADVNPRRRFALMAARFYRRQPETVVAVTGTNGKTSTAVFARQIWERLDEPAASLGTLGLTAPGRVVEGSLTTPDPVTLHRMLAELADAGVRRVAMEASSHGLDQFRLDGVRLAAAAFTNLTRDHLDYHGTMQAYLDAKLRLFTEVLQPGGTAVLNADVEVFPRVLAACQARGLRVLTVGRAGKWLRLDALTPLPHGQTLRLTTEAGRTRDITVPLVGAFQAWNLLGALGLVAATGADLDAALAVLPSLDGVPGRMQLAATLSNGAAVFVDYAHTPDALETVLTALRPHASGRLTAVFGAGGDRDPGKRPLMGAAVARLADKAIVTDDNPRTEDPAAIRAAVLAACPGAEEIGDRAEAIRRAVAGLRAGDVLVIAGKGHERGQTVGTTILPFDDVEVARAAVAEAGGRA